MWAGLVILTNILEYYVHFTLKQHTLRLLYLKNLLDDLRGNHTHLSLLQGDGGVSEYLHLTRAEPLPQPHTHEAVQEPLEEVRLRAHLEGARQSM